MNSTKLVAALGVLLMTMAVGAQTKSELRADRENQQKAMQAAEDAQKKAAFEAQLPGRMALVNRVMNQYAAEFRSEGLDGVKRMSHFAMTVHSTPSEVLEAAGTAKTVADFMRLKEMSRDWVSQRKSLGDNLNLVFLPIGPCRFADSRFASAGILLNNVIRTYQNFSATGQGGDSGCNSISSPGVLTGSPGAIAMNIAVAVPSVAGNLIARPVGATNVTASSNFVAGDIISNATVIKMTGNGGPDFELLPILNGPATASTHVILDLLGFYVASEPAALDCNNVDIPAQTAVVGFASASATCGTGFTVTGGSCDTSNSGAKPITASQVSGNGWVCETNNYPGNTSAANLFGSARCCRVPGNSSIRF
jgi:hypothetical protein